jgi:hypothetical protein
MYFRCPRGWEQTADWPPLRQGEAEAEAEAGLQGSGSQACLTLLPSYICSIIHPEWCPLFFLHLVLKKNFTDKKVNKMSEWVAVCADESEEPVEIPTETDGESVSVVTTCSSVNFVRCDIPICTKTLGNYNSEKSVFL